MISIKWCDLNKGDEQRPAYRSRLVGRELKKWDPFMSGTFAATPPTESLRFMLSDFMTRRRSKGRRCLMVLDVSRAHFHPPATRELYIQLPDEDWEEGKVGRLLKTIYGTRDAAASWEQFYVNVFEDEGFESGQFCPCLFKRGEDDEGWVHGDDMLLLGYEDKLLQLEANLGKHMILKRRALLGFDERHDKSVTILNRIIELRRGAVGGWELTYEPDPRHAQIVVAELGLAQPSAKAVSTPGVKGTELQDTEPLRGDEVRIFRSICMRLSYLAMDLPHLLLAAKEA